MENAMQRKARLERLAKAGDDAKKKLGIKDKPKKETKKGKM
jgi:hypothetical protein